MKLTLETGKMQNGINLNGRMQAKILYQEHDLLILTGMMQDNFKIYEKQKTTVYAVCISQRELRLYPESGSTFWPEWDGRTKPKIELGCGIQKPVLDFQKFSFQEENQRQAKSLIRFSDFVF